MKHLTGEIAYPSLRNPDPVPEGKKWIPNWGVCLVMTSDLRKQFDEILDEFHEPGMKKFPVLNTDAKGRLLLRIRRPTVCRKENNTPPFITDAHDSVWNDKVENGMVCKVWFSAVPWTNKFGSGLTFVLEGAQVLEDPKT